ncbi:MAG: hypothetical protein Q8S22_02530, partial [Eubacteriales bacterium]|nr:hypothetical protein [Eubacteriales bacterium]
RNARNDIKITTVLGSQISYNFSSATVHKKNAPFGACVSHGSLVPLYTMINKIKLSMFVIQGMQHCGASPKGLDS